MRPAELSVTSQSAPSGPRRTSRMRSLRSLEQALLLGDFLAVEFEPHQDAGRKAADEQIAFPLREQVARIERHARGRDHRRPLDDRLLHAGLLRAFVDARAAIIDAVADHRPAVILSGLRNVDLVAAARAVLVHPQFSARGIDRGALRIAVAVGPDFRLRALPGSRTDCRAAPSRRGGCARSCR